MPTDTDWQQLGAAIRERRRQRELTMVELATRSELSQPFLSQVENGRASPSMESLYRIALALDTTPQALFGVRAGATQRVVRHADEATQLDRGAASAVRLLLPGDAPFHVLEFDGLPGHFREHWRHDGFEAVYVLAGTVELELDGEITLLGPGDFTSYPSQLAHRHRQVGSGPARLLMIETKVDGLQDQSPGSHVPTRRRARR